MMPNYLENLTVVQNCVDHNYEIIKLVIKDAEYMFENKTHEIENVSLITGPIFFSYLTNFNYFSRKIIFRKLLDTVRTGQNRSEQVKK